MAQNCFAGLSNNGPEEDSEMVPETSRTSTPSSSEPKSQRMWQVKGSTESGVTTVASLSEYPWITNVSQGTRKRWNRHLVKMSSIAEEADPSNVESRAPHTDGMHIEFTIDNGAAEHVVGP